MCMGGGGALLLSACNSVKIQNSQIQSQQIYQGAYAQCDESKEGQYVQEIIANYFKDRQVQGNDIKVQCRVTHYHEGSRAARYFVGFGVGAAKSMIVVEVQNKQGKKIGSFDVEAEMKMGAFGGSSLNTLKDSAIEIAKYIERNYILNKEKE